MEKQVEITKNIVIGTVEERSLEADLFLPAKGDENGAAIVIVHGGGWREGDKGQLGGYGLLLAREGFVCCVLPTDFLKKESGQLKYKILNVQSGTSEVILKNLILIQKGLASQVTLQEVTCH